MAVRSGPLLLLLSAGCLGPAPIEAGGGAVTKSVREPGRTWVGRITQGGGSCSASLIEPRIVITAKHCLDEGIAPSSVLFLAGTGLRADTVVARAIGLHSIGPYHVPQGVPPDDFAAIALDRAVTLVPTGPAVSTRGTTDLQGRSVLLVGFGGLTNDGAYGTRRRGKSTISNVFSGYTDAFMISADESTATDGDSGGPVILESTGQIIGVVSGHTMMARADLRGDLIELARQDVARTPAVTDPLDGARGGASGDRRTGDTRSGVDCPCDVSDECDRDEEAGGDCTCDTACDPSAQPEEEPTCDCDATWSCDLDAGRDCWCDPECPAEPEGDAADEEHTDDDPYADDDAYADDAGCACDTTWSCDDDADGWPCACDIDCDADVDADVGCDCDETWDCDLDADGWDCACDPEC